MLKTSSGASIIIDCSREFLPCNKLDTLLLIIKAFCKVHITFSESGTTMLSRFKVDDLKNVVLPIVDIQGYNLFVFIINNK